MPTNISTLVIAQKIWCAKYNYIRLTSHFMHLGHFIVYFLNKDNRSMCTCTQIYMTLGLMKLFDRDNKVKKSSSIKAEGGEVFQDFS